MNDWVMSVSVYERRKVEVLCTAREVVREGKKAATREIWADKRHHACP